MRDTRPLTGDVRFTPERTVIMTSESNSPSISGSKSVLYPDQIKNHLLDMCNNEISGEGNGGDPVIYLFYCAELKHPSEQWGLLSLFSPELFRNTWTTRNDRGWLPTRDAN
ncbi:hypothetical protein RRG08_040923 [Elysia crispata]|uniref:Uncharacterized protein n=1 Tax=Elysia crispata TaxID=231223 RepID=A0AAE0ZEI5_9GAST|nr:hypothetical protein RRG08_040923 [Elysia crispata]